MSFRVAGGFAAKLAQSAKSSMNDVGWMVGEMRKHRMGRRELGKRLKKEKSEQGRLYLKQGIERHRRLEKDFDRALGKVSNTRIAQYLNEKKPMARAARRTRGFVDKILLSEYGNVQLLRRARYRAKMRKVVK